jgi:alpha-N-arabinofuranosidase
MLSAPPLLWSQAANPMNLQIHADQFTARIPASFYGLMTEEINYAYEGGLYGELVRNRNFKEAVPERRNPQNPNQPTPGKEPKDLVHWALVQEHGGAGAMELDTATPLNGAVPASLKLTISQASGAGTVGISNEGFWGIPVKPSTQYKAMFYAKAAAGFTGGVTVSIVSNDGATVAATGQIAKIGQGWQKYEMTLTTSGNAKASAENKLVLSTNRPGTLWFGFVSLFPPTYKNRANGNRADIMQLLANMHPKFLRFPGGNYLEGNQPETRFDWKKTIGPIEERPGHMDDGWGYWTSDGLGLVEYLGWCEDLGMEPVLAVYAGYSMRQVRFKPGPELDPYVKEALEEIEYVTGDVNTIWGARRAKDGHPAPFKLQYVEVGNEDNFDNVKGSYDGRFTAFYDAIRAKYPELKIIATTEVTTRMPDVIDEHFYRSEEEMALHAYDYDARSRGGRGGAVPKVFVGEWATRVGSPTPNLHGALGDAAWLTGLERSADLILMNCYAPLFVNVNPGAMQWQTDLIGYNTMTSYGSPAYWVQQVFSTYHGDLVLPMTASNVPTVEWQQPAPGRGGRGPAATPAAGPAAGPQQVPLVPMPKQLPLIFSNATRDSTTGIIYVKIVNRSGNAAPVHIALSGLTSVSSSGKTITISSASPEDTNSITDPNKIVPVTADVMGLSADFTRTFPPYSVTVLELSGK